MSDTVCYKNRPSPPGVGDRRLGPRAVPIPNSIELAATRERANLATHAVNTKYGYSRVWDKFLLFTEALGVASLPATLETIELYACYLAPRFAQATVRHALAGVAYYHGKAGFANPAANAKLSELLRGLAREYGKPAKQARELLGAEVVKMVQVLDEQGGVKAIRDKAAILCQYGWALRVSELLDSNVSHLDWRAGAMKLLLPRSKTDQEGAGTVKVLLRGKNPATDPMLALKDWLEVYKDKLGREPSGSDPIFPALHKAGDPAARDAVILSWRGEGMRMGEHYYQGLLKSLALQANITNDVKNVTAHGLRAGHVTTAAANGARDADLQQAGPWRSPATMAKYVRAGREEADNTSGKIGL